MYLYSLTPFNCKILSSIWEVLISLHCLPVLQDSNRERRKYTFPQTKIYKFNELNEDAKRKAIEWYRNGSDDGHIYADEIIESVKEVCNLFNLKYCLRLTFS